MNIEISYHFITGAMVGIEFVTDEDAKSVVFDLVIIRLVVTAWANS